MNCADPTPRRPRFLLLAYACSPTMGSEPGVGWNRALQAARLADTWVICEESRYGPGIRQYLAEKGPVPGLTFHFLPRDGLLGLGKLGGTDYVAYNRWHRRAFRLARRLHAEHRFDLAHQVTFCGYREPGYLYDLGVPFVWGPVGGTQNYPWRFLSEAPLTGAIREGARNVVNALQLRFSPRVRTALRRAAVVLAANTTVQRDLARAHSAQPAVLLETGLTSVADAPPAPRNDGRFRLLWSGELQPWKALSLLLEALARVPAGVDWELRILGKGPLESVWRQQAERLGIGGRLQWLGWLPHAEALAQYPAADVFAFTSLRDTSGNVVLESLAAGVPVVCLDHQGVRDIVTPECGVKVPVTHPAEVVAALARGLTDLAADPPRRSRLAWGALARARDYLWSSQGERMAHFYRLALERGRRR
jgi:glycosyltransferase involved in cell wall biosynthesis